MVEEATEKQIKFAESLGIKEPKTFSKQVLKELIQNKLNERDGKKEKTSDNGSKPQIEESRHDIVIQRTEKPHSYEFGKPNNRHKIYYGDVSELKTHIKALEMEGYLENEIEIQKI